MRTVYTILSIVTMLCIATVARAAIIQQELNFEYSGGTAPEGASPWLRAEFDDGGTSGSVTMTLTALNLTGSEFVNDWYFNLNPALNPNSLNFAVQGTTGSFATPTVRTGLNAFKAAGNTRFDILVDFANAPPSARFGPGESITYLITGIPSLNADSFNFLSVPGGHGPFISVAKVQAIGQQDGSGWVALIPEPGSLLLISLSGAFLLRRTRRIN